MITLETNDERAATVAAHTASTEKQGEAQRQDNTAFDELFNGMAATAGDDDEAVISAMAQALMSAERSPTDSSPAESAADSASDEQVAESDRGPADSRPAPSATSPASSKPKLVHAQSPASQPASVPNARPVRALRPTTAAQRKPPKVGKLTPTNTAVAARASNASATAASASPSGPNG